MHNLHFPHPDAYLSARSGGGKQPDLGVRTVSAAESHVHNAAVREEPHRATVHGVAKITNRIRPRNSAQRRVHEPGKSGRILREQRDTVGAAGNTCCPVAHFWLQST